MEEDMYKEITQQIKVGDEIDLTYYCKGIPQFRKCIVSSIHKKGLSVYLTPKFQDTNFIYVENIENIEYPKPESEPEPKYVFEQPKKKKFSLLRKLKKLRDENE